MFPIVVNSTKKYANSTLPLLLESFEKYKGSYNPEIIVIIGGYDKVTVRKLNSYTFIEVDNNTIDYTGLIYILENDIIKQEHFLYIHDTIIVGESFFTRHANLAPIPTSATVSFQFPSSFIGIYSKNVLHKYKDYLLGLKNKEHIFNAPIEDLGTLKLIFSKAEFVAKVCDKYAYFGIVYLLNGLEQFDATVCLIQKTNKGYETKLFDDSNSDFNNSKTNFSNIIKNMM